MFLRTDSPLKTSGEYTNSAKFCFFLALGIRICGVLSQMCKEIQSCCVQGNFNQKAVCFGVSVLFPDSDSELGT